ncbi:MAG: alanine--tRNA ligase, partial [Verrucomicrobia bacterium]|nr:alanine--tRNA ligase [Verrucomicrobiota bacterium]
QRPAEGLILHIGRVVQGRLARGEQVAALVDAERRNRTARHHSGTHLLHYALRELVSPSIKQAGSYVAPDRLRFDISYFEALPEDKLDAVERRVNDLILENVPVTTCQMPFKDVAGSGIIALFDEKYGDTVRVVEISGYSRELCGGTHVRATGDLGLFRIVSESSVAAGVRRIEAVCGRPAYEWTHREHRLVRTLSRRLSASPDEVFARVEALMESTRRLEKELKQQATAGALGRVDEWLGRAKQVNGIPLIVEDVGEQSLDVLRSVMDALRARFASGVIVLGSRSEGKACFLATVSEDLLARGIHAGRLVGPVAKAAGGGGGGQPGKAQAGGKDASKVAEAIALVEELLAK